MCPFVHRVFLTSVFLYVSVAQDEEDEANVEVVIDEISSSRGRKRTATESFEAVLDNDDVDTKVAIVEFQPDTTTLTPAYVTAVFEKVQKVR